jgi:F-type H+-transporting ATPase subunit epsilon
MAEEKLFKIDVTTPDELVISDEIKMAVIPGEEGEMGILAHHSPVISTLKTGVIYIYGSDDQEKGRVFVSEGFADINNNECSILATRAYDLNKLTQDEINDNIEKATAKFNTAESDFDRKIAEEDLELNRKILEYI